MWSVIFNFHLGICKCGETLTLCCALGETPLCLLEVRKSTSIQRGKYTVNVMDTSRLLDKPNEIFGSEPFPARKWGS